MIVNKLKSIFSSGPKTAALILGLILCWMILGIFSADKPQETLPDTADHSQIEEVLVKRIEAEPVNREISILGQTRYSRRVMISALTEGRVSKIGRKEGQMLGVKDIILKLDDREARAQYQHALSVEEQKQLEYDAYEKLFNDELISVAKLADARSQLESAKAEKIQKQIQLDSTRVTAPFAGKLQSILVEEGDYVRVGQELAEVLDFSPFIVSGEVSEKEAVYIETGLAADARLIDGSLFHGTITYMSSLADSNSRSFAVELSVDHDDKRDMLSGISATMIIPLTHDKAHKLSSSSLEINKDGKFGVKLINEDNVVMFQEVEILKSSEDGIWVQGLPDIATVIVRGQGFVNSGDIVKPVFESLPNKAAMEKDSDSKTRETEPDNSKG